MKHKFIYIFAAAAAVLLGTAACNDAKKEFDPNDPAIMTIAVQPDIMAVIAEEGATNFQFTAPDYWFVSSPVDWLTFEPKSGKPGEVDLKVTVAQNTGVAREALITVTTKYNRGQFKISQAAWPYSADTWNLFGTVQGGNVVALEDKGDKLVWEAARLPFNAGEAFKFRMGRDEATVLGLNGALAAVEGAKNTFKGSLKKGGESITLPEDGWWDVTLDLTQSDWTVTAVLNERYPWTINGSVFEDVEMTDLGEQLVWQASKLPFHIGDEFRFRMNASDVVNLGLNGALTPVEGENNTYTASLKRNGDSIVLPDNGMWDVTLDLNELTMKAVLADRFSWTLVTGDNWDTDTDMTPDADKLIWNVEKLLYHAGEVFKFRMDHRADFILGLSGALAEVADTEGTYTGSLEAGGNGISLPGDGYWNITLDLNEMTVTASFAASLEPNPLPFNWIPIWENDDPEGHGSISWSSTYRFGLEGQDGNNECIATLPEDIWNKIKTETFYVYIAGNNPVVRVTTGWWTANLTASDIGPGNELLTDNQGATWILKVNLAGSDVVAAIDQQHLLFTGDGYTVLGLYYPGEEDVVWQNQGAGNISWSSTYRFGLEGFDGANECIATFPEDTWNKLLSTTFYIEGTIDKPGGVQIRVTNGWWAETWNAGDLFLGDPRVFIGEDETSFIVRINISDDSAFVATLEQKHLLFTGDGWTLQKILFYK